MADDYVRDCNVHYLGHLGHELKCTTNYHKQLLLSAADQSSRERGEDARDICAQLAQLDPEVASLFVPKREVLSQLRLRLVIESKAFSPVTHGSEVHAAQKTTPSAARQQPSFIAVSYAWHNPEWQTAPAAWPISPGWEISKPMVDAVMGCRENEREGVWIDRLCVNQNDDRDKTTHIGVMDVIYKSARRMIIVLEDVQLSADEASIAMLYVEWFQDMCTAVTETDLTGHQKSAFLNKYMLGRDFDYIGRSDDPKSLSKASILMEGRRNFLAKILAARWFTRAWCAHESRVTPHRMYDNPLMLCFGPDGTVISFEFRLVQWLSTYIVDVADEMGQLHWAASEEARSQDAETSEQDLETLISWTDKGRELPDGFHNLRNRISQMCNLGSDLKRSTLQQLFDILTFGCSSPQDFLSIALNTSNIPLAFLGKVKSTEEVIEIFRLFVLAENDAAPLLHGGWKLSGMSVRKGHAFPGSVPSRVNMPALRVITRVTRDFVELDLLIFKTIPAEPTSDSLAKATALIAQYDLEVLVKSYASLHNSKVQLFVGIMGMTKEDMLRREVNPQDAFVKTWLAHGIDCGPAWMARFPDLLQKATQDNAHGVIGRNTDGRLSSAARALCGLVKISPGRRTWGWPIWAGQDSAVDVKNMARFLRTILDPRLKAFATQPRRLAVSPDDYAIIGQTTNVGYVAIPLAFAHASADLKRAWVLEPFDPVVEQLTPEREEDYLPDPTRSKIEPREKVEDVFPLLTSDFEDRRVPRDDGRATWRLRDDFRGRCEIFGCQDLGPIVARLAAATAADKEPDDGGNLVLLRRQKVYGAKNHDWTAVAAAFKRLQGGEPEERGTALEVASGKGGVLARRGGGFLEWVHGLLVGLRRMFWG